MSNFDKIVGGLTWCIETCNFDVDVDLLFQEDLSIGKKIALTVSPFSVFFKAAINISDFSKQEKIVAVTNQMKCPTPVEPHQIQGLDYIHIHPVVQWLVKKAIENREAAGDAIRKGALRQYDKLHDPDDDGNSGVTNVDNEFGSQRLFKQTAKSSDNDNLDERVNRTLMEYGHRTYASKSGDQDASDKATGNDGLFVQDGHSQGLLEETGKTTTVKMATVNNLVKMQSETLTKAAKEYNVKKVEADPKTLVQAIKLLEERRDKLKQRIDLIRQESERVKPDVAEMRDNVTTMEDLIAEIDREVSEQNLDDDQEAIVDKLQSLVIKNETLKEREAEFKETCREEMKSLSDVNDKLRNEVSALKSDGDGDSDQDHEITVQDQTRLNDLKLTMASRSREVASIERRLDSIPSRYELAQYQRRFFELDNQVAAEYSETQKFVTLFNTLQDQKTFMEREAKLLNSILDCIPDAKLSSSSAKDLFVQQLEQIMAGINAAKSKVEAAHREQQIVNDQSSKELAALVDLQRTYSLLVRDMREEMKKS